MVNIFILKLETDKYYVGSCNHHDEIKRYFGGNYGPEWIKLYPPVKLVEVISPCDIFDIDKHTKRYMALYGVNNVRGGAYTNIKLSKSDCNHIDKEIFTSIGMCMHCGSDNHTASFCPHNTVSSKFKNFLNFLKTKLRDFSYKIQNCYRGEISKFKKYDTLKLNENEDKTLLTFVDSPKNIRTMRSLDPKRGERLSPSHSFSLSSSISLSPPSPPVYKFRNYHNSTPRRNSLLHPLSPSKPSELSKPKSHPLSLTPPPLEISPVYSDSSSDECLLKN